MRPTKSVSQMTSHISKAERDARKEAEDQVVNNHTVPKVYDNLNKEERKVFHRLKKYNDNFTEADSISLNMVSMYIIMWSQLKEAHNELDIMDERLAGLERRITAIDKQINQHMTALCIPLNARLKLANDLAKTMIEEKKLEQMEGTKEFPVNPLDAVLEQVKAMG
ncbi:hypothetical protein [Halobacillus litoralis]|uniref:hypothetical protein n=1 Tax=Halobacillus litoralis TaxID=45668 RepID=UPI00248FA7E3|nr:hypothetical protein [Halobacillus litoralis]